MTTYHLAVSFCGVVFLGMILFARLGHRVGFRLHSTLPEQSKLATGVVDASVLSLLGLLTAFTFSSAYSRYDARRNLIVEETNAIGTALLRLDLIREAEARDSLKNLFRDYVRNRHELWLSLSSREEALAVTDRAEELQSRIWNQAVIATQADSKDAGKLLLPALNQMFDLATSRFVAIQTHPPFIVFLMLGVLSLAASWIIGFAMRKSEKPGTIHLLGFAAIGSLMIYTIVDIEFPRHGFVTLDAAQQLYVELEEKLASP